MSAASASAGVYENLRPPAQAVQAVSGGCDANDVYVVYFVFAAVEAVAAEAVAAEAVAEAVAVAAVAVAVAADLVDK